MTNSGRLKRCIEHSSHRHRDSQLRRTSQARAGIRGSKQMLVVLLAVGAAFTVVIASAVSDAAPLRRRYVAVNEEEPPAQPRTEGDPSDRGSNTVFRAAVPIACVLVLVFGCLALIARTQSSTGPPKLSTGDARFPCKASGGPGRLLQLGDLDGFHLSIHTSSRLTQKLFNAGLLLEFNFNQAEALRAFELAAAADPKASMPHWGRAYALGPGANRDITQTRQPFPSFCPEDFELAQYAAETALQLAEAAARSQPQSKVVQQDLAFAKAVSLRFAPGSAIGAARAAAEESYATALVALAEHFNSSKASAIAAESYMNLSPWNYYQEPGVLRDNAAKAEGLIAHTLAQEPDNPLALHLHIHISEASNPLRHGVSAARAEASADRMTGQGPWEHRMGHLLHMPSHTFVRLGRWHDGVVANQHAFQADLNDSQHCRAPYLPEHNLEMLIYSANMGGQVGEALRYARAMRGEPDDPSLAMTAAEGLGGWAALPLLQSVHALWGDVLAMPFPGPTARGPCPDGGFEYAVVVYHYTRTLALAARCRAAPGSAACSQAEQELQLLQAGDSKVVQEVGAVPGPWPGIWSCDYKNLSMIYAHTGAASVAVQNKDLQLAEEELQKAAAIEDVMAYQEPPRLLQPVRHALGAVLLQAGQPQQAEQVYREDLAQHPVNGFSVLGLSQSLAAQGKQEEANSLMAKDFQTAWSHADVSLNSSSPSFA